MSDVDGDSTMHSSPDTGGIDDDDNMFPDEANQPSTPRNAAGVLADRNAELSPPDSQGPPNLNRGESSGAGAAGPSALNANGKRLHASAAPSASSTGTTHTDPETGYQWSKPEDQPGWEWKNARAKEDEHRALESIIDKSYMIKTRYGDPLDPTVQPTKRR